MLKRRQMSNKGIAIAMLVLAAGTPTAAFSSTITTNYEMSLCGGVFNPCTVSLSRRLPSAQELAGLSSDLFMEFFKDLLRGQTGTAQWTVTDSSANGVIIGSVHAPNQ